MQADLSKACSVAQPGEPGNRAAFTYYLPRPVPRGLDLSPEVVAGLSDADAALGLLQGLGILIRDPSLLIGPYLRREALASSRIEGTQASLSDVLQAEIDDESRTDDTGEVERYLEATARGMRTREDHSRSPNGWCSRCMPPCCVASVARRSHRASSAGHRSGWGTLVRRRTPPSSCHRSPPICRN